MPQIVWEHLAWLHVCLPAQGFHQTPHGVSADRLAAPCQKNAPRANFLRFCIPRKLFPQCRNQKNASVFALAIHYCLSPLHRLNRDILQLADAYARATDGLQNQAKPLVAAFTCSGNQAVILLACQLLLLLAKDLPLHDKAFDRKLPCPAKMQKRIERGKHGICARYRVMLTKMRLVVKHKLLVRHAIPRKRAKRAHVAHVFLHGCRAFFILFQICRKCLHLLIIRYAFFHVFSLRTCFFLIFYQIIAGNSHIPQSFRILIAFV